MLEDDKLNHMLKRVIKNTTLAGTYESVHKKPQPVRGLTADINTESMSVKGINEHSSINDLSRKTRTTNKSELEDEDEAELKEFRHLPKQKIAEVAHSLFDQKVKELTYPKNPTLFTKVNKSKIGRINHASPAQKILKDTTTEEQNTLS